MGLTCFSSSLLKIYVPTKLDVTPLGGTAVSSEE